MPVLRLEEVPMAGAPFVIALVGLVFPILLLLGALLFDAIFVLWTLSRVWHDAAVRLVSGRKHGYAYGWMHRHS